MVRFVPAPKLDEGVLRANPTTGSLTFFVQEISMTAKSIRTTQPNQFLFDWSISPEARPALPDICSQADSPSLSTVALPQTSEPPPSDPLPDPVAFRHPDLLQVLPWDFRTSFPQPMEEAILNGTLQPEDAEPENLASLHEEHARHGLALLHDLDAVTDARRAGVDPRNGKAPRTPKQREVLEKLYKEELPRLEREFDTLIDVYEEVFGADAAGAFRKTIRAWHAGVEVIGEAPPTPRALTESITAGVFGVEEDGTPVNPGDVEVAAITECVADALMDRQDDPEREELLKKYADDFGPKAAEELDRWSSLKPEADETRSSEYDPGHPWHYCERGDGADPLPLEAIPARTVNTEQFNVKWPKNAVKRRAMMQQMLAGQRAQLVEDEQRYQRLIEDGADALSQYDREIAHGGDDELAWASAISLKYNHISGARGRVLWLEQLLGVPHTMTPTAQQARTPSSSRDSGS